MTRSVVRGVIVLVLTARTAAGAGADEHRMTLLPVFARPGTTPTSGDGPTRGEAERRFAAECLRRDLPPVEVVDLLAPAAAPGALERARLLAGDLKFREALAELDLAAVDAGTTGAAGLSSGALDDIFFLRATTRQKIDPSDPRGWDDYVRAVILQPERALDPGRVAPAAMAAWRRAALVVQGHPRGDLVVHGPNTALVSVDAHAPVRLPAVVPGLAYGEHLVRVEEPGRRPWATSVALATPALEMNVPARAALGIDDVAAADLGQRKGAASSLVGQFPGPDTAVIELRLVDVATHARRATISAPLASADALEGAIGRLVALAEGHGPLLSDPIAGGPGPLAAHGAETAATARAPGHPRVATLLVVAGALAAGLVAGLLIANARAGTGGSAGYSVEIDRTQIGQ